MMVPRRTWLLAAAALTALAGLATSAEAASPKHRHVVAHRHVMKPQVVASRHSAYDLDITSFPEPGAGHNYISDSRAPAYNLGPSIFQRQTQ